MLHRWRSLAVTVGLVPLLAACTQPLACTAIGCVSQVSVDVSSAVGVVAPLSATGTVCVDGTCRSAPLTYVGDGPQILVTELPNVTASPSEPNVDVTLTITRGSTMLVRATTTTTLGKVAPNGEQCGPICWQSSLVLVGGRLVPAATPSAS